MRIFESIGYDVENGNTPFVAGYYVEGDNGLYAFTYGDPRTINVDIAPTDYSIDIDPEWPFIRKVSE